MVIIDSQKSVLENLYFISGPVIAVLGLFIFRQIMLAKAQIMLAKQQLDESRKQLKITSQRQAACLAADKVNEYCKEIIPLGNELYRKKLKINYPEVELQIKNFTIDEMSNWDKGFVKVFLDNIDISSQELNIINKLEAFSVYFIKGIADEKIAFNSIGPTYCKAVRNYYQTICLLRGSKNPNNPYENLIQLYKCWSARIESFRTEMEKEELSVEVKEKISQLEVLRNRSMENEISNPIGT